MKLQNDIQEVFKDENINQNKIDRCAEIANQNAIGFSEWKDKLYLEGKLGLIDRGFTSYDNGKTIEQITSSQLLEIYNNLP